MSISAVGTSFPVALDDPADIYKRMSCDALGNALIKAIETENLSETTAILNSGRPLSSFHLAQALCFAIERKNPLFETETPLIKEIFQHVRATDRDFFDAITQHFFPKVLLCAIRCSSPCARLIWEIIKENRIKGLPIGEILCAAIRSDHPLATELWNEATIGSYNLSMVFSEAYITQHLTGDIISTREVGRVFSDAITSHHPLRDAIWYSGKSMDTEELGFGFLKSLSHDRAWAVRIFNSSREIGLRWRAASLPIAIRNHFPLTRSLWGSIEPQYNESLHRRHVISALFAALEYDHPLADTLWSWITRHVKQDSFEVSLILCAAIRCRSPLVWRVYREYSRPPLSLKMSPIDLGNILAESIKHDSPLTTSLITSKLEMDPVPLGEALVLCWTTSRLHVARLLMAHRTITPRYVGEVFLAARKSGNSFAQEILDSSQTLP